MHKNQRLTMENKCNCFGEDSRRNAGRGYLHALGAPRFLQAATLEKGVEEMSHGRR